MSESYRELCGNPKTSLMFPARESKKSNPLNMANIARRKLAPVLNRCAVCQQSQSSHGEDADHKFERDTTIPGWHGWHAFRSGTGTEPQEHGAATKDIAAILGHANDAIHAITDKHYVKETERRKFETIRRLDNTNVQ